MTTCSENGAGKWSSEPYEEFVSGASDFVKCRMAYADDKGYRYEQLPNGVVRIFEAEIDFLRRTTKQIPDKPADTPT